MWISQTARPLVHHKQSLSHSVEKRAGELLDGEAPTSLPWDASSNDNGQALVLGARFCPSVPGPITESLGWEKPPDGAEPLPHERSVPCAPQ